MDIIKSYTLAGCKVSVSALMVAQMLVMAQNQGMAWRCWQALARQQVVNLTIRYSAATVLKGSVTGQLLYPKIWVII